jgi:predicted lipoprotein with Yx(FWY)xxD motif
MKSTYWIILVIVVVLAAGYFLMKSGSGSGTYNTSPVNPVQSDTSVSTGTPDISVPITPAVTLEPNNFINEGSDPNKGNYLVNIKGMTLYIFDNDQANISNCTGTCAQNWPAYTTPTKPTGTLPANLGTFTRTDGTFQFTWNGMPLYFYSGDKTKGDINGDGIGGIWHMVII